MAKKDPKIKQKYDKIQTLNKWYADYKKSFTEQKKTLDLLKSYGIGLNINKVKYKHIKNSYLKYLRNKRQTYQNMVIIFLAIVWIEIKDTTNIRIERFIEVCGELGHKTNKKMLNNAMLKVKKAKTERKRMKTLKTAAEIELEIKHKIKVLFQKDLNSIPFDAVKDHFLDVAEYEKLKIEMQLLTSELLDRITYKQIQNSNFKAFTAGFLYYVGLVMGKSKIFTQSLIQRYTHFSSTTIRKKNNALKKFLGMPSQIL